ncbi:MAG: patatin-like phospholipase family protein [Myxococcota bacterium]
MLGLVLSGGGARGAYEAGVLRYVLDALPRSLGVDTTPRVICGTSIGALTGAWVGALGTQGARHLSSIWQRMEVEDVYRFTARDLVRVPERLLGRRGPVSEAAALFDPAPLYRLMRETLPWSSLHDAIDGGRLKSFVVCATDVASGFTVLFADGEAPSKSTPTTRVVATRVGADHCLASAAIPLVFPAVAVEGRYYVDGALRQNTPLSPAVSLGVDRALVIGVKRSRGPGDASEQAPAPTAAFLAGKALNALMLDPIEEDLRRLAAMNGLLQWGQRAYPDFMERVHAEHKPYRVVRFVHVRPSLDLGRVAAEVWRAHAGELPWATRTLLRGIAREEPESEADLLSYLLFHKRYTAELEALGFEDARRSEEEIAGLFAA